MTQANQQDGYDPTATKRQQMVDQQLRRRDIVDPLVLEAMAKVPRHRFTPPQYEKNAYGDRPLPIGHDQTISQPYIVALMTQLSRSGPGKRALDVGTGSGYQAAILAELCDYVYSLEIIPELAESAQQRLADLGYHNISVRCGDAFRGWPEQAPFDVIIAAAAPRRVPPALIDQLATGGRLVIPVGGHRSQELLLIERLAADRIEQRSAGSVSFVPMTGEALRNRHQADEPG